MNFTAGYLLIAFSILLSLNYYFEPAFWINRETGDLDLWFNGTNDKRTFITIIPKFKKSENE